MPQRLEPYVLVIDDNDDMRAAIAQVIQAKGWVVRTAENGSVGLQVLRTEGPAAVVLVDLMMPVMDGPTFLRRQLAEPTLAGMPVILMTAASGAGPQLPVAAVLRKPFDTEQLLGLVATLGRGPWTWSRGGRRNIHRRPPGSPP